MPPRRRERGPERGPETALKRSRPSWRERLAPARWPWPLPALVTWVASWLVFVLCQVFLAAPLGGTVALAMGLFFACLLSAGAALLARGRSPWRRGLISLGFPASLVALSLSQGAASAGFGVTVPAWAWLAPALVCLALYPPRAWRDAPLFPTPHGALRGLAAVAPLAAGTGGAAPAVLDAGCGLGHGLRALRHAYPAARVVGLEWSWPLAAWSTLRCPWARVRRGDIWRPDSWRGYALVYLFQRPESMERAWHKACEEMAPGSWLVSLEFPVPSAQAEVVARLESNAGRTVWVYRVPGALPLGRRCPPGKNAAPDS